MPSFCLPCWSSKSSSNYDEGDKPVSLHDQPETAWLLISLLLHQASARKPEKNINDTLAKPTVPEYAGEGAKVFLDVLESVAGPATNSPGTGIRPRLIPVPGVAASAKVAKTIMQACDVSLSILTASRFN